MDNGYPWPPIRTTTSAQLRISTRIRLSSEPSPSSSYVTTQLLSNFMALYCDMDDI
jgi:hypothetical protein